MTLASSFFFRGTMALLVVAFSAGVAAAEPSAVDRETARTLLISGREKRKEGRLAEALADFQKAHAIMHVPTTARDLGKAQEDLGMLVEARATFLEAVRIPEQPNEPPAFRNARTESQAYADAIAPRLASLTIAVPNGARLTLDGVDVPVASRGVPLKVNPGKHVVVASGHDGEKRTSVELREGGNESVTLAVGGPITPAPRPDTAGPPAPSTVTRTSPLVWIGLGVLGVGTAVGTTTGILAFTTKDDIASRCDGGTRCPPSAYDDVSRGETYGTISTVAFVVAGAGAAVMIYGLFTPSTTTTASTTGFRWHPTPMGVVGTFR